MRVARVVALLAVGLLAFAFVNSSRSASTPSAHRARFDPSAGSQVRLSGIHKIRHVVIIMQENRSFDSYFGTFRRADGIPGLGGHPGRVPCMTDPGEHCVRPFHDRHDLNGGGPHSYPATKSEIHSGLHDFIKQQEASPTYKSAPADDVMGYHTARDIPNYWKYARDFVLQDHMFESVASWSFPAHLFLTSMWSARCTKHNDPASCTNAPRTPAFPPGFQNVNKRPVYAWTDLTYLLHMHHVSWRYYMFNGTEPLCDSNATQSCTPVTNGPQSATIWYPVRWFDTVRQDHQARDVQSVNHLFTAATIGTLPAVSWVVPSVFDSEHNPGQLVTRGQTYVTGLINALMRSPEWKSTAIFLTWDDPGGFYDNAVPPKVDENGYGLRVPGLVISPYAKHGYVDHQILSFDAYAKFIEDDFMGGAKVDPSTDGRPDPRPDVRESAPQLGDLVNDFNFNQKPRKRVILPVHPKTDLIEPTNAAPGSRGPSGWG